MKDKNKDKRTISILLIIIGILALVIIILLRGFSQGGEDTWIKNERGVYVPHGKPSVTPEYVKEQERIIKNAISLYFKKLNQSGNVSSECLGTTDGYAVDVIHEPRTPEDNLPENQCNDLKSGRVGHYIELDNTGRVIRII